MKRPFTACALTVLLLCSHLVFSQVTQVKNPAGLKMQGAYVLLKQALDSGTGPALINTKQMKIFTDKYMMYAHRQSATDSTAGFGIGTYKVENGKVIEMMFFDNSGPVNESFELTVNKQGNGYSQLIDFPGEGPGKHFLLNEDYKTISRKMTSPLDGAWKMKKLVFVDKDGKTESVEMSDDAVQFKLFESGHFMWTSRWKDEKTGTFMTAYGYGTFQMNGPDKAVELNESSTFATFLNGKTMHLDLKFTGNDSYEQTIVDPDGSKRIETYERLK